MKLTISALALLATAASANFAKTCEAPLTKKGDILHGLCMNLAFIGIIDIPKFLEGGKFVRGPFIGQPAVQVPQEQAEEQIIDALAEAGFSVEQASSGFFGDVISTDLDADGSISQVGTVNQGAGSFDITGSAQATGGVGIAATAPIPATEPTEPQPGMPFVPAVTEDVIVGPVDLTFSACPVDGSFVEDGAKCVGGAKTCCVNVNPNNPNGPKIVANCQNRLTESKCVVNGNFKLLPALCRDDVGVELTEIGELGDTDFTCFADREIIDRTCPDGEPRGDDCVVVNTITPAMPATAPVPGEPGSPGQPGSPGRDAEEGTATSDISFDVTSNGSQTLANLLFEQTARNAPFILPASGDSSAARPPPATTNLNSAFAVSNENVDAGTSAAANINLNASTSGSTTSQSGSATAEADSGSK